jgi:hypothetical protein
VLIHCVKCSEREQPDACHPKGKRQKQLLAGAPVKRAPPKNALFTWANRTATLAAISRQKEVMMTAKITRQGFSSALVDERIDLGRVLLFVDRDPLS